METGYVVGDVMTRKPVVCGPLATLKHVADLMATKKVGSILVAKDSRLMGIITERDLIRKAMRRSLNVEKAIASSVMTPSANMVVTKPTADVFAALRKMDEMNVRHLPVVAGDQLVGLITLKDILRLQPELYELIADKYEMLPEKVA